MKKPLIVLPFISLFFFVIVSFGSGHPAKKKISNAMAKKGFAVVELFTSEGCSSCPPADDAVAALAKDYPSNVFVLGFHVDYWNSLGWKDEFSAADYTNRQQQYAGVFQLNSIYTPQVVINGKTQFTGSDKSRLYTVVAAELNNDSAPVIELEARAGGSKGILVDYKTILDSKRVLHIALVQLQAASAIKKGENKGRLLHHTDVVRSFKTVGGNTGSIAISLSGGLAPKDCKIIAFVQNKSDMHITAAGECMIQE